MLDTVLSPFSEVPVHNKFHTPWLGKAIFAGWLVLYLLLTIWNVLFQGYLHTYNTVLLSRFDESDDISCPPATIRVGETIATRPRGLFRWTVTAVTLEGDPHIDLNAFAYADSVLRCEMNNAGLTYTFQSQSFFLGTCGNCSVPTHSTSGHGNAIVTLCSSYDIQRDTLPSWTEEAIARLQASVYTLGGYYQQLTFPSGAFPDVALPPYGQSDAPPPTQNSAISPALLVNVNTWIGGFRYASEAVGGNGTYALLDGSPLADLSAAYDSLVPARGNVLMNVAGIGAIRLGSEAQSAGYQPGLPATVRRLRSSVFSSIDMLLQMSLADLNGRPISTVYLCTSTERELKPFLSMVALIMGANAGVMATFLAVALWAAGHWDQRRARFAMTGRTPLTTPWSPHLRAERDPYGLSPETDEKMSPYESYALGVSRVYDDDGSPTRSK